MSETRPKRPDDDTGPWYKEPWPWLLMMGPAIVVVAGFFTYYIAAHTDNSMVTDDYYKEGKNIIKQMNRDEEAEKRQLNARLIFNENLSSVRIFIKGPVTKDSQITLNIHHPTMEKRDQKVTLKPLGGNLYQANIVQMSEQSKFWYLSLEDESKQWRLQSKWTPADGTVVEMAPSLKQTDKQHS